MAGLFFLATQYWVLGPCYDEDGLHRGESEISTTKELTKGALWQVLACDVSQYGLGTVLSHIMDASWTLTPAEKNYSQIEKERLAIIFGVKKFHNFLLGSHFSIESDHQPLSSLFNKTKGVSQTSSRIQRWALLRPGMEQTTSWLRRSIYGTHVFSHCWCPSQMAECSHPVINYICKDDWYSLISVCDAWTSSYYCHGQLFMLYEWRVQNIRMQEWDQACHFCPVLPLHQRTRWEGNADSKRGLKCKPCIVSKKNCQGFFFLTLNHQFHLFDLTRGLLAEMSRVRDTKFFSGKWLEFHPVSFDTIS